MKTPRKTNDKITPVKKAQEAQKKAGGRAGLDESTDRTTGADRSDERKTSWKGKQSEDDAEIVE